MLNFKGRLRKKNHRLCSAEKSRFLNSERSCVDTAVRYCDVLPWALRITIGQLSLASLRGR